MKYQALNYIVLLILSTLCILNFRTVNSDDGPSLLEIFCAPFSNAVHNSSQLLQVFDIKISSFEISRILFEESWAAMEKSGVPFSQSAAKAIADAVFVTVNFMSQKTYINALGHNIALYLLSQNILKPDNAAKLGARLANLILLKYPANDVAENVVNHSTLIRAMYTGVFDFLAANGRFSPQTKPFQPLNLAKHYYSITVISEPEEAVSIITNTGIIQPAVDAYGITAFSLAFSQAVDSSKALQTVFNVDQPLDVASLAWSSAGDAFCASVNCYNRKFYTDMFKSTMLKTYHYISRLRFVKAVSNAYAMLMIELGTLSAENADSSAKTLTSLLETLLSALPSDSSLEVRLIVVFKVLESLVPPANDVATQYVVFSNNLCLEFFAATPIQAPMF